jgi:glycine cleavage system protein P-like pyridoxal-binding family
VNSVFNIKPYSSRAATGKSNQQISKNLIDTNMVTASLTTPAIVTVTALVTETKTYSVSTCEKIEIQVLKRQIPEVKNTTSQRENKLLP